MPPRSRLTSAALVAALLGASAEAAAQGDLVYTVTAFDDVLRVIDPITAVTLSTTVITTNPPISVRRLNGMTRDPVTGTIYVIVMQSGSNARHLATLDPNTAVASLIAPLPDRFAGLAARADGTLFGVTGDGANAPSSLFIIDPATAATTFARAFGGGTDGECIAFGTGGDPRLYHASGLGAPNVDEIFERVETFNNYLVTRESLSGHDYDELMGMTAYARDTFLATDLNDDLLLLTTQGHCEVIGALDHGPTRGIVVVPSPNTQPFFRAYGRGCEATSNRIPTLFGAGTPSPGQTVSLELLYGPANALVILAVGVGQTTSPIPGSTCLVQVEPVIGTDVLFTDPGGAVSAPLALPVGLALGDFFLQLGVVDGATFVVSNPLQMHMQ